MYKASIGIFWLIFCCVLFGNTLVAESGNEKLLVAEVEQSSSFIIDARVRERYDFHGLATYYNNVNYYVVNSNTLISIEDDENIVLDEDQWLAVVGRLKVLVLKKAGLSFNLNKSILSINNPELLNHADAIAKIVNKSELSSISPQLDQIRYAHLWKPLAWLAKLVESSLVAIQNSIVQSWGLAILIFSILLKILLLPVSIMTVRSQRKVSQIQSKLLPRLQEIKAHYKGEEAHNHLMAAHKELGVSPFYTLKPIVGQLIQIPILIAVFNALGEMSEFQSQTFLWISDLAYPDTVGTMSFSVPMFGNQINLLPFLMTLVTLLAVAMYQNHHAPKTEVRRQKRNLCLMALAFFILFYPFPAVMVYYWTLVNVLQILQQKIIKI